MPRGERWLPDEELSRPAAILAKRFLLRWDLYSIQLDDGRYICVHEPLSASHLYAHLRGEVTLGTYLLNQESKVRFVVLDNDAEGGWDYVVACGGILAQKGLPAYLEKSRRGGHIWLFFAKSVGGSIARNFAQGITEANKLNGFEIYPKQDTIGKRLGSLIRLPFGVHRLTGRRYGFYESTGKPLGNTFREQIASLQSPQFVSKAILKPYEHTSPHPTNEAAQKRLSKPTDLVSERIKAQISALEFISQYVDLKRMEVGAVGLCPFHDDEHPSFGVNDKENYWHCFAGCGGGSVIDFWSLWRKKKGLDSGFVSTINELADMLL